MDKIRDRLWLGSWRDAYSRVKDPEYIVITVADEIPVVGHYHYPITDPGDAITDLMNMKSAVIAIENALKDFSKQVLVHCVSGVNRSPSTVIAYLMKCEGLSFVDAHNLVKSCRPINPVDRQLQNAKDTAYDSTPFTREGLTKLAISEHEEIVNKAYKEILGRDADPDGLRYYSEWLASNDKSIDMKIRAALMNSEEYRKKNAE